MIATLLCSILGVLFAVYGVYSFTKTYTCRVTNFNKTINKWCMKIAWAPSACLVAFILGMAVFRSQMTMGF
jgi:hypothetical protein